MTDDECHSPCGPLDGPIAFRLEQLLESISIQYRLSPREKQVLRGAAMGDCTKGIAQNLKCSPKTVEEYWRRIYVRFRLFSRQQIVARLLWEALAGFPGENRPKSSAFSVSSLSDKTAR